MAFSGAFPMLGGLSLRFPQPSDEAFLLDMFMAARPWIDWSSNDRDFVRHLYEEQYRIARSGVGAVYPQHLDFIIEKTAQAVGHLTIDLGYADWRISLFEVHPQARGKGIGSDTVRSLQAAAGNAGMPLAVATPQFLARARSFYGRLGFRVIAEQPPMVELGWVPPGRPWPWQAPGALS